MTLKQAIGILKEHQKWRLGEIIELHYTTQYAQQLTQAINTILKHYDNEKNN